MKPVKVVYNACFGGFGLSEKAAERLAKLKVPGLEKEIADHKTYVPKSFGWNLNLRCLPRHDPRLVKVVEELGEEASGTCAHLAIYTLKGNRYIIDEYDGHESVSEPKDIMWIVVEEKLEKKKKR